VIFESLFESAQKGELVLVDNGFARFHIRRDGQMTLHEIIVTRPGCGIGTALINQLRGIGRQKGATCILAKCPQDLPANRFYASLGFTLRDTETTPTGRKLNVWQRSL